MQPLLIAGNRHDLHHHPISTLSHHQQSSSLYGACPKQCCEFNSTTNSELLCYWQIQPHPQSEGRGGEKNSHNQCPGGCRRELVEERAGWNREKHCPSTQTSTAYHLPCRGALTTSSTSVVRGKEPTAGALG